jgi:short-subunit dehydrogenase
MFDYRGSTAMITGASKGLGAAFAKELAGRGMNLILAARSIDTLQDLADSLGAQNGVRCVALQADLAVRRRKADRDGARAPGSEDRSADQQCRAGSNG